MAIEFKSRIAPWNRHKLDLFLADHGVTEYTVAYLNDFDIAIRFENEADALWYKLTPFDKEHTLQIKKVPLQPTTHTFRANRTIEIGEFDSEIGEELYLDIADDLTASINANRGSH